jgi:hypothetical protein
LRSVDFALFFVELKAQTPLDEAADGAHRPVPGALAANVDVAVVSVAAEAVTPLLKELVEIIEHDARNPRQPHSAVGLGYLDLPYGLRFVGIRQQLGFDAVRVPRRTDLPPASFGFHLAVNTLAIG